jgi:chemotaxis protein MotB
VQDGVEPGVLSAAGYGPYDPVATNASPDGQSKNRRIEITLVPNLDDLPPIDEALKEKEGAAP